MPTVQLLIKGKVQGVYYRVSAKKCATELSLTGWVRNTANGDVEVLVTGDNEKLQKFILWCRRGPSGAIVLEVTETPHDEIVFDTFSIKH